MAQTAAGALGVQLGKLLFGRPDSGQAFAQGQAAGALVDDRMASARKNRANAMITEDQLGARQGINPDALKSAGYEPGQAELLGSILRANASPSLTQLGQLQLPTTGQALNDARDAFKLGDVARGNTELALAQGKPIETTKVADGQVFNPYGDSGQNVPLTALGQAMAREKNAHAGLYDQQRAAGGFSPRAGSAQAAAANGTDAELLSPDAQDLVSAALSHGYAIPLPNFGFSQRGAKAKADALNELAQRFKGQGVTMDDAVSSMINGKTATTGLTDIQRSSAKVNAWENSAARQADIATELSNQVDRTGVPMFNRWLLAGRQGTGDPAVASFNNSVATLAEEYARVMGGGNATATDSTRALAHTMLNSAMTQKQFSDVVALMKREMATRKGALGESVMQQRAAIVAPATPLGATESAPAPAAAPAGGTTYRVGQVITVGGKQYRVTGGDPTDPDLEPL